jgi:hypothetical protein
VAAYVRRQPVRWPVGFPGDGVEISRHAALDADSVRSAPVANREAQVVQPAAEHSLHESGGRVVERVTPRCMFSDPLAIDCVDALHF